MSKSRVTVARFLEQQIALSDLSQKEIASRIGYDKPNVLTMIKQGHTKLPIGKIGAFAKVLNIDPGHLLRLTVSEYMPETWDALEEILDKRLISEDEYEFVKLVRNVAGGVPLSVKDKKVKERLTEVLRDLATAELKDRESAARAVAAMPSNGRPTSNRVARA